MVGALAVEEVTTNFSGSLCSIIQCHWVRDQESKAMAMDILSKPGFNQLTTFPFPRNASTYEVSSSQSISSPQRSKRVKENTPPRCAMVHNSPACSTSVTCSWGDVATSTTRERQRQTIIIPDTPSPAVSVITISSDTDEEEEQKHAPTRWAAAPCSSLCAGLRGREVLEHSRCCCRGPRAIVEFRHPDYLSFDGKDTQRVK